MKNGSIIEEGRHNELISHSSEYALLYTLQANRYVKLPDTFMAQLAGHVSSG